MIDLPSKEILIRAYRLMCTAQSLTNLYEKEKGTVNKYVHATSRGHEAIQIACGMHLETQDYLYPYYRDDSILLTLGFSPYELMLQLLAKKNDPFSSGRTYYCHPSYNSKDKPFIPHQSSATGMQAIPATGAAMGITYKLKEKAFQLSSTKPKAIVVCSLGDASCTEGEVAEAFQMATLKQLPIIYLVQDNEWDISAKADEIRSQDISHFAKGFKGLNTHTINGTDFNSCHKTFNKVVSSIRKQPAPHLIHAKVPLLNHHTSGVRMEFYRDDLEESLKKDPLPKLKQELISKGVSSTEILKIETSAKFDVQNDFEKALKADNPNPEDLTTNYFKPTKITKEEGNRKGEGKEKVLMVDAALFAIKELLSKHPECLLYGQDVGERLGGVFREAATLGKMFGKNRVFNTPIQEAFIVGSTAGMSAVGLKPIVEVQFADYIWPGLNQLFTEISRSCYLSDGKWPVSMVLRVPSGAYGSGGPYHSSSVESIVTNIRGIKVVYPSNAADLKGLMKSAYYDPNPVVILEHKGLYWSKIKGTESAKTIPPDENYKVPIGKSRLALACNPEQTKKGQSVLVVTYGMGVHWALEAAKKFDNQVEIIDLRSLSPIDYEAIFSGVRKHNKLLLLTEESTENTFTNAIAGKIQESCFEYLDAPIKILGSIDTPAIPINEHLEKALLPNTDKVSAALKQLLIY